MKTFTDSLYYAFNVSTTLGFGDIVPTTNNGKIITIIQALLVYISVSKFIFQTQPNFIIFGFITTAIILAMSYAYKFLDNNLGRTFFDYVYFSTITHTTVGFGDHKAPLSDNVKMAVIVHILLVFTLLNSYNNGLFSQLRSYIGAN